MIGGAGTGKSEALARRFAWLAAQGAVAGRDPRAQPLGGRRGASCGAASRSCSSRRGRSSTRRRSPTSAAGCCATRRTRPGVDPFFARVSRAERLALLLERIDDLTLRTHEIRGNPVPLLVGFLERIDALKSEMITADDYVAHARALADADRARADDAARAQRGARGRVRRLLRRPRPARARERRARHRRPRAARLRAAARAARRAAACVGALRARARGRLPGRELRRGARAAAALPGPPPHLGRRRRRPGHQPRSGPRRGRTSGTSGASTTDATVFKLPVSQRCAGPILAAAQTVVAAGGHPRIEKELRGPADGDASASGAASRRAPRRRRSRRRSRP